MSVVAGGIIVASPRQLDRPPLRLELGCLAVTSVFVERPQITAVVRARALATAGVAEHAIDTLLDVPVRAVPEALDAVEVVAERRRRVVDEGALGEVVAPRISVDAGWLRR